MFVVTDVKFEHYNAPTALGVQESTPRLSWNIQGSSHKFEQAGYEIELIIDSIRTDEKTRMNVRIASPDSTLVPWPLQKPLESRQIVTARVRIWDEQGHTTPWSLPTLLETGLLEASDWKCQRVAGPLGWDVLAPQPEQLFRKQFDIDKAVRHARLYITAQGVYEAETNGRRVGDYFLAPGWTAYDNRLQYQTYDVTSMVSRGQNCLGVRVAEGWFSGRIGFRGGHRNIWGDTNALLAQLEVTLQNGQTMVIVTDDTWLVTEGPIRLAEIYDGEKYDATREVPGWSLPLANNEKLAGWKPVTLLSPLPQSVALAAGFGEPVRRIETVKAVQQVTSPSGKLVLDFGQNLVGYLRLSNIKGSRGQTIRLSHAEVLEQGELGTRPLRYCKAVDEYTLAGSDDGESYEPRFTFHGFRYVQIDGWPQAEVRPEDVEAVVCHTDMQNVGSFSSSLPLLDKLFSNIRWSMRGNFLSIPTDCPQRDERLGWTGDLALFAPTAVLLYNCFGIVKNWLVDLAYDQKVLNGVPPMVTPNATIADPVLCRKVPCAIWHDATILVPWALYEETGDITILAQQYESMETWMKVVPRGQTEGSEHLWDSTPFQLGDWLDPDAPSDAPWKSHTDARMVANMFLVNSLERMAQISSILGKHAEAAQYKYEAGNARREFNHEYITGSGRITSDTQAAYALAICFDMLDTSQAINAGNRLAHLARKNGFRIGTGFTGTPYVCEALVKTGHVQTAYSMLLETECPSWLYPITMGATTVWERWDSMLPDGSINPGNMTSFNHYALGAIAKFLLERIAGLRRLEPGWTTFQVAPIMGANLTSASASHLTPKGLASSSWHLTTLPDGTQRFELEVRVPQGTRAEIIMPGVAITEEKWIEAGRWTFQTQFQRNYEWPIPRLPPKCN